MKEVKFLYVDFDITLLTFKSWEILRYTEVHFQRVYLKIHYNKYKFID